MDLSCGENLQQSGNNGMCREQDRDRCVAGPDRALDNDPRLIHNLLVLERTHGLHIDYFQHVQTDVQPFMRKVVTTWMLEVCEEQMCEEQVFPLAVSYMDRFLSLRAISRQQLQLLAVVCMLIASKFRQCHPLGVDILCAYTDHSVQPDEVRQWEVMVLQRLEWQISAATGFDFVEPLLARVPWAAANPLVRRHAHTLISVCYTECDFLLVPPSLIAVACIMAATRGLQVRGADVSELCSWTSAPPAAAELAARHVERVLARETAPTPRALAHSHHAKTPPSLEPYTLPETPTDVQDIQF